MSEQVWLESSDPQRLLNAIGLPFLSGPVPPRRIFGDPPPVVSERKVRLFLAECSRLDSDAPADRYAQYSERAEGSSGPVTDRTGEGVGFMAAMFAHCFDSTDLDRKRSYQCHLLRCIFGNPFKPVAADPAWQSPNAVTLAWTIYDERRWEL